MNENDYIPVIKSYNNLPPFKGMVIQQFPFIEEDFDAITNYQLLCKVVEYLKSIYNNNIIEQENITALYNAYTELVNYIDTYFENLDVQEEINNKLDAMAESGELTAIIKDYVDPFINAQNVKIDAIETKVDSVASGSPLVASSTEGMTDTTRVYVNTTDGKWYYYDGDSWEIGGTYQATGINPNDPVIKDIEKYVNNAEIKNFQYNDFTLVNQNPNDTINPTNFGYVSRLNTVSEDCYVNKIIVSGKSLDAGIPNNTNGTIKLCKFTLSGNTVTDLVEHTDNLSFSGVYSSNNNINEITLSHPFLVEKGYYIGIKAIYGTNSKERLNMNTTYSETGLSGMHALNTEGTTATFNSTTYTLCCDFELVNAKYVENISKLRGKTLVSYGDSITAGYGLSCYVNNMETNQGVNSYPRLLANDIGLKFYNYGYSGQGYSMAPGSRAFELIRDNVVENADIVTVAFGTNDFGLQSSYNIDFGDIGDESTGRTFYAYVKRAFDMLVEKYPTSSIYIILPMARGNLDVANSAGKILSDYVKAINEVANLYGFSVINLLNELSVNAKSLDYVQANFQEQTVATALHPNQNFQKEVLLPILKNYLLKHYNKKD